jgi:magnesium transporter
MNFNTDSPWNMPELHWKFGYEFFWLICAIVAGVTFYIVKRKKWL